MSDGRAHAADVVASKKPRHFADPIARLEAAFGSDQFAQGKVFRVPEIRGNVVNVLKNGTTVLTVLDADARWNDGQPGGFLADTGAGLTSYGWNGFRGVRFERPPDNKNRLACPRHERPIPRDEQRPARLDVDRSGQEITQR